MKTDNKTLTTAEINAHVDRLRGLRRANADIGQMWDECGSIWEARRDSLGLDELAERLGALTAFCEWMDPWAHPDWTVALDVAQRACRALLDGHGSPADYQFRERAEIAARCYLPEGFQAEEIDLSDVPEGSLPAELRPTLH